MNGARNRTSLVLLALAALAVYAFRLAHTPPHLHRDEVMFALQAQSIAASGHDLEGRRFPLYFEMRAIGEHVWFHPALVYVTATTTSKIRFNVVGVPSIEPIADPNLDSGQVRFAMRFRDNGTGARVYAKLKRDYLGGFGGSNPSASTVIATLDSDLATASNDWQTVTTKAADCCVGARGLSFLDHGYVVEVQLIKSNASGTPAVLGVQLFRDEP